MFARNKQGFGDHNMDEDGDDQQSINNDNERQRQQFGFDPASQFMIQAQTGQDTGPNSSMAATSQESSLTGQGLLTYNKTIMVRPDELIFNQVGVNQAYSQVLTMQNTLSAPVELVLKSSNQERLELAPKSLKLQPHEQCQVTATFRQPRPFPSKTTKQKETIFIKSDFFDQKVAVTIFPAQIDTSASNSSMSTSLQRAGVSQGRSPAFNQMTSTMTRQQLATTTIGKGVKSPTTSTGKLGAHADLGANDSFGRATASDIGGIVSDRNQNHNKQQLLEEHKLSPGAQPPQTVVTSREFGAAIQQSDMVEVTMAADSKADIVSGAHYLGSDYDIQSAQKRQFESHETALMRQQLNEIRGQNETLKKQLAAALAQQSTQNNTNVSQDSIQQQEEGAATLEKIKALLNQRDPKLDELLTEAMRHEKVAQKKKDAKVLEILQFKDQQITEMTQALSDHKVLKSALSASSEQLAEVERQLNDAKEKIRQLESKGEAAAEDEDQKFQELIKSQNKVNEQMDSIGLLESQLSKLQVQVDQGNQTRAFYEESLERVKSLATLTQGKLDASERDLELERSKTENLEQQLATLRIQLNKDMNQSDKNRLATQLENSNLQEKIYQMQDQMQSVYRTLGKVTGDKNSMKDSSSAVENHSKASTENDGFDEQLAQRAEEIVLIVEQVQAQYTLLEQEMRSIVNRAPTIGQSQQTELKGSDIDDMNGHFEALQAQVRQCLDDSSQEKAALVQQLNDARNQFEQLKQSLANNKQTWMMNSSTENLLTNRHSSQGGDSDEQPVTAAATVKNNQDQILISERGAQETHRTAAAAHTNLGLSAFSASQTTMNKMRNGLQGHASVATIQGNPGGQQNQILAEMQDREHQLMDQLSILKEQMRFQTSHSEANTLANDPATFNQEHLNLRIGELETLVFQQREQILGLQDHNANLQTQLNDKIEENKHKLELYEVRNHNLQELNQKYQDAAAHQSKRFDTSPGGAMAYLNTYSTALGANHAAATGITSPDYRSQSAAGGNTGNSVVETERIRQHAQELDLKVLDLEHALKETQISLKHSNQSKLDLQTRLQKTEQEYNKLNQDALLQKSGVNVQDSKLALLVQELKNKLKMQQQQAHSQALKSHNNSVAHIDGSQGNLSQQAASLYALREEYSTKLEKLIEANAEERSEAQNIQLQMKQKIDGQATQLKVFEDKEIRLFSQFEDLRSQKAQDEEQWNQRIKDLNMVLDSKQQICSDLEREVKSKEKMLAERQEQLSILLSAMEQQSSLANSSSNNIPADTSPLAEAKNKLANLAAELCSLKAVEAQMERKCTDLAHNQNQMLQKSQKYEQQLADAQVKIDLLTRKCQTLESSNELLERQKQDLTNKQAEINLQRSDNSYKLERLMFQLKTKEETIACLKTQQTQAEVHFKEQIDRIREDLVLKQQQNVANVATLGRNRDTQHSNLTSIMTQEAGAADYRENRPRREVALKIAIQQLHLVIADYIERSSSDQVVTSMEEAQKNIISEMEKALGVAQTTIQRLEADLDRERHKTSSLENQWDALALNGILMTRQEKMTSQLKGLGKMFADRDAQSVQNSRQQADSLNRVIRDLEVKLDSQAQLATSLDQEVQNLKVANKRLIGENEELQANVMCYTQEQAAFEQALEKKAQITVDERHRQRTEALKSYYDETIAKQLIQAGIQGGQVDQALNFGQEISALQLLIDKQRRDFELTKSEKEGIQNNLRFYKGIAEETEQKLRDLQTKAAQDQVLLESYESGANRNAELDKRKQECLNLEKELIRQREVTELKSREVTALLQRIEAHKFDEMQIELGQDLNNIARKKKDSELGTGTDIEVAQEKIQSLQEQLMEIRGCHIQELEELKVQCDVDVAEAHREMSQQQRQFESKFMPGTAPGEILDQNHELRERVAKLQVEIDHLLQDGDNLRNQLYEAQQQQELLHNDLQERDQALGDLEHTLLTQTNRTSQPDQQMQPKVIKSALKGGVGITEPGSTQSNFAQDGLVLPCLIRELFSSKRAEIDAKQKLRMQLQTEIKLRQQLTTGLQDELNQQRNQISLMNDQNNMNSNNEMLMVENTTAEGGVIVVGEEVVNQLMAQNANLLSILQDSKFVDLGDGTANIANSLMQINDPTKPLAAKIQGDMELMIKTLIYFANTAAINSAQRDSGGQDGYQGLEHNANQQLILSQAPLKAVVESQRVLIRALTQRHQNDRIRYAPEREVDRKVWYLELLEEQVSDTETQINRLQDFVKRLQIGVSGSLHSAAEIKASSMDLASNLQEASGEMKSLRNVAGLIKHDVLSLGSKPAQNNQADYAASIQQSTDFNPFLTGRNNMKQSQGMTSTIDHNTDHQLQANHLQQTQHSNMERILNEHESMHNQLNLTSKIKQSLETELVQSKLAHASELQTAIQKMSAAENKLHKIVHSKSVAEKERDEKEIQLQVQVKQCDELRNKISDMEQSMHTAKLEAGKARDSSKQWQKMQTDMQEWRRSNEESLRAKHKQLQDAQAKVTQLKTERKRMKAEVTMLRQNQKEIRDGSAMEQLRLENKQLVAKFNEQLDERKKEIEFWVQERAQMRDKIDQLEIGTPQIGVIAPGGLFDAENCADLEAPTSQQMDKLTKKLKSREIELKQVKSDLLSKKNQISKAELKQVKMEAEIREAQTQLTECTEKLNYTTSRLKELQIEKDMLQARQVDARRENNQDQIQIEAELDKMRQEFAKLKVQRDELQLETDGQQLRERQWRDTIDGLNRELVTLQNALQLKESESSQAVSTHDKKNQALLSDLRFMRDENQKLHDKLREANECVLLMEQQVAQSTQYQTEIQMAKDQLRREASDQGSLSRAKDLQIAECQAQLQANETGYFNRLRAMQSALSEVKSESAQTQQLLQTQLECLKTKLLADKKATSKEIEQSLTITQKEAMIKQVKKELVAAKSDTTKLKAKNKELKAKIDQIPSRQAAAGSSNIPSRQGKNSAQNKAQQPIVAQSSMEKEIAERLAQTDGLKKLLDASKNLNDLETQITEGQIEIAKVENWNYALQQQLEEAKSTLVQAEAKINELIKDKKDLVKDKKQASSQQERVLRDQLRTAQTELDRIKEEWSSPQAVSGHLETITQLKENVKQVQGELNRKNKHLGQVKIQKEQTSKEQNQAQTDLQQLKDENNRLRAQARDSAKNDKMCRDLRGQIEWLTKSEKRLKEEILSLNEKLKTVRAELARKDQHLRDYKDRMDLIQSEVHGRGAIESEVSKLKDLNRRQKIDLEVKENQVKTLRSRLEQNHTEILALNEEKSNLAQQDTELGQKFRSQKQKTKRYETNLLKSVHVLKKIGVELAALEQKKNEQESARFGSIDANSNQTPKNRTPIQVFQRDPSSAAMQGANNGPMGMDDLTKDAAYYKDSVEILGLSMNEMESFINPNGMSAGKHPQGLRPPGQNEMRQYSSPSSLVSSTVNAGQLVNMTSTNAALLQRLERMEQVVSQPRELNSLANQEIEEIGDYCVQMINSMVQN